MASASAVRIPSRTADGKHTKRFIIEYKDDYTGASWYRSFSLPGYFPTREEAQAAINALPEEDKLGLTYRVRMK